MVATAEKPRTRKPKETTEESPAQPAWRVDAAALRSALGLVAPAATTKFWGHLVELSAAGDGRLTLTTNDHELMLAATIDATVETAGTVAAAHDVLSTLARGAEGLLACRVTSKGLDVTGEGTQATVRAPADAPPPTCPLVPEDAVTLPAAALARAINRVERCADGPKDSRTVLTGISLRAHDGRLAVAAADGFRLGVAFVEAPWPGEGVIVPARGARALAKLLDGCPEGTDVRIGVTDGQRAIVAETATWRWASRLIDGTFPDWTQIIPREALTTAELDREALAGAVAVATGFAHRAGDDQFARVVTLFVGGSALGAVAEPWVTVNASDADRGQVSRRLPAEISGTPMHIALNVAYLRDALAAFDGGGKDERWRVRIGLQSSQQAITIREAGPVDDVIVIMPMIIGSDGRSA